LGGSEDEAASRADLERYCALALEEGAAEATIVPANDVPVDERVRLKCVVPRCLRAGVPGRGRPGILLANDTHAHLRSDLSGVISRAIVHQDDLIGITAVLLAQHSVKTICDGFCCVFGRDDDADHGCSESGSGRGK
jgi:hypothetical protein